MSWEEEMLQEIAPASGDAISHRGWFGFGVFLEHICHPKGCNLKSTGFAAPGRLQMMMETATVIPAAAELRKPDFL